MRLPTRVGGLIWVLWAVISPSRPLSSIPVTTDLASLANLLQPLSCSMWIKGSRVTVIPSQSISATSATSLRSKLLTFIRLDEDRSSSEFCLCCYCLFQTQPSFRYPGGNIRLLTVEMPKDELDLTSLLFMVRLRTESSRDNITYFIILV
jgi:hypothetical protein